MINKPYYRIYRPFSNPPLDVNNYGYLHDQNYCKERKELIRYYKVLEQDMINIFNFIEPCKSNENTYSLKTYQLFMNICIEVENNLKGIIIANGYSKSYFGMEDYFKLNSVLKLNEYTLKVLYYTESIDITPFADWNSANYQGLKWYQAYNKVKHNRSTAFNDASLINVITALGGLYILLYAQFFEYCKIMQFEGAYFVTLDDGELWVNKPEEAFFSMESKPTWVQSEKYDFDWNSLKNSGDSFQKLTIT